MGQAKFNFLRNYSTMLNSIRETDKVKKGVDLIIEVKEGVPAAFRNRTDPAINMMLKAMANQKQTEGLTDQAEYIRSKAN